MTHIVYAVRQQKEHWRGNGFAVLHPKTGDVVLDIDVDRDDGLTEPIVLPKDKAEELASQLTMNTNTTWSAVLAPSPCANCGSKIPADELDFCYQENREGTEWVAGCFVHNFGCGHEVHASSYEEALALWNQRKESTPCT